jgi:hypothetical protein
MLLIFPLKCTRRKVIGCENLLPLIELRKNREVPLLAGIEGSLIPGFTIYLPPHLMAARVRKPAIGGKAKTLGMKSKSTQGFPPTH